MCGLRRTTSFEAQGQHLQEAELREKKRTAQTDTIQTMQNETTLPTEEILFGRRLVSLAYICLVESTVYWCVQGSHNQCCVSYNSNSRRSCSRRTALVSGTRTCYQSLRPLYVGSCNFDTQDVTSCACGADEVSSTCLLNLHYFSRTLSERE